MINKLKKFFDQHLVSEKAETEQELEHRLQLASAVLLLEVAQADRSYSDAEREKVEQAISSKFSLQIFV